MSEREHSFRRGGVRATPAGLLGALGFSFVRTSGLALGAAGGVHVGGQLGGGAGAHVVAEDAPLGPLMAVVVAATAADGPTHA
jgi:hypothetical protein